MKIRILDAAKQDLIDGVQFYKRQSGNIGDYFLNSIFSDIDSLNLYAGLHSIHYGYYRLLSKRFPFAIYYKIENKTIDVWAIIDCRQNPIKIVTRLAR